MATESHSDIADPERYWLDHIQRCGDRLPLAEYARDNDLRVNKLYYWSKRPKQLGLLPAGRFTVSFAAVEVSQPAALRPARQLRFPNGMVMEWKIALDGVALESLLSAVHCLP